MVVELEYFRMNVFQRLISYLVCKTESYKCTVFLGELLGFCHLLETKFITVCDASLDGEV